MSIIEKFVFRPGCCTTEPKTDGDKQLIVVRGPCHFCGTPQTVTVDAAGLERFRAGEFAQNCFPGLDADKREFLISGICPPCWDKTFAEEDDGETTDD